MCVILCVVIYPVGNVMHLFNNWLPSELGLVFRQLILDAILSAISRRGGGVGVAHPSMKETGIFVRKLDF